MCRRHVKIKIYLFEDDSDDDDEIVEDDTDDDEINKKIYLLKEQESTPGRAPIRERALSTFIIQRLTNTLGWLMH